MKLILWLSLVSVVAFSQAVTLSSSSATVRPGQQVSVTVGVSGSPATAAFNFTVNQPAGWTYGTATAGSAATAANKLVQCGVALTGRICIVYGAANNTLISAGPVATIPFMVPANAAPGPVQISLSGITAGSANASPVTLGSPGAVSILVLSLYDLNGDGAVDNTDLQPVLEQIVGSSACSTGDFNGDGRCDSIDLLIFVVKGVLKL